MHTPTQNPTTPPAQQKHHIVSITQNLTIILFRYCISPLCQIINHYQILDHYQSNSKHNC